MYMMIKEWHDTQQIVQEMYTCGMLCATRLVQCIRLESVLPPNAHLNIIGTENVYG